MGSRTAQIDDSIPGYCRIIIILIMHGIFKNKDSDYEVTLWHLYV